MGANGSVIATTDGGETWLPQPTALDQINLTTLFFLDSQHGWVAEPEPEQSGTSRSWVARTSDGGQTWTASDGLALH